MRIRIKLIKGATKKEVYKLQSESWAEGFDHAKYRFSTDFQRRLVALEKDGITKLTIEALKTWYQEGK